MKRNFENISNSELTRIIDNWVKGERNRRIMKRRLIDRICYEPLAEEFELSVRQVKSIVYKNEKLIFHKIQGMQENEIQEEVSRIRISKKHNMAG